MLWDVIYSFLITLTVELLILFIVKGGSFFYHKYIMKKVEFDLNGHWKNSRLNQNGEEIVEIVKIKQVKYEIKLSITQYKKESVKKYQGGGVISGDSIATYYCGKNQAGIILLGIKNDTDGKRWLEGEFLEGPDLNSSRKTRNKNVYRLDRISFGIKEKWKLFFSNNKYIVAKVL